MGTPRLLMMPPKLMESFEDDEYDTRRSRRLKNIPYFSEKKYYSSLRRKGFPTSCLGLWNKMSRPHLTSPYSRSTLRFFILIHLCWDCAAPSLTLFSMSWVKEASPISLALTVVSGIICQCSCCWGCRRMDVDVEQDCLLRARLSSSSSSTQGVGIASSSNWSSCYTSQTGQSRANCNEQGRTSCCRSMTCINSSS